MTPAYQDPTATTTSADIEESPEAQISLAIAEKAELLNWSPVQIYQWVKNNIETEWYHGAMKGAEETLRQLSGNDADQAALLVALLRAADYPARYVKGVIEFYPEDLSRITGLVGVEDPALLAEFFQKAGIPFQQKMSGLDVVNYQIEHVWVETLIPYSNYRGVLSDAQGQVWLPLDTSIKVAGYTETSGVLDIYSEPTTPLATIRDDYLATAQTQTPLEYLQAQIQTYLDTNHAGMTYQELLNSRSLVAENLQILPAGLQFNVLAVTGEYTELPATHVQTVRFQVAGTPEAAIDITLPAHDLSNQKVVISFEPETVEDQETINLWGGLDNTPGYLVRLRPVLEVNGKRIVVGKEGYPVGGTFDLTVEVASNAGMESFQNTITVGYPVVMGVVAQDAILPDPADLETIATDQLYQQVLSYSNAWSNGEKELASLLDVALVRPLPSVVTLGGTMYVVELLGEPQGTEWRGLFVDADLRRVEAVERGTAADDRERTFMELAALEGSVQENKVYENGFGVESISTAKLFGLAHDAAANFLTIDINTPDYANLIAGLPFSETIKTDLTDSVVAGFTVQFPDTMQVYQDWSGIGYIKEDPVTGEAGYMLSGMTAGGYTVVAKAAWPPEYLPYLVSPFTGPPNTDASAVEHIYQMLPWQLKLATVGEELDGDLMALVTDIHNKPVEGAQVQFDVDAGAGYLLDGVAQVQTYVATTGYDGVARARFVPGTSTFSNPVGYTREGDKVANIVGENLIDATLLSGSLVSLEEPFTIYGFADEPDPTNSSDGAYLTDAPILTARGYFTLNLKDQYGNGIANYPVVFTAGLPNPQATNCSDLNDFDPAKLRAELVDRFFTETCPIDSGGDSFAYGSCPEAQTSLVTTSVSNGGASVFVVRGVVPGAEYPVSAQTIDGLVSGSGIFTTPRYGSCEIYPEYKPSTGFLYSSTEVRKADEPAVVDLTWHVIREGIDTLEDNHAFTCDGTDYLCDTYESNKDFYLDDVIRPSISIAGRTASKAEKPYSYEATVTFELGEKLVDIVANGEVEWQEPVADGCEDGCGYLDDLSEEIPEKNITVTFWGVDISAPSSLTTDVNVGGYLQQATPFNFTVLPSNYTPDYVQILLYQDDTLVFVSPASLVNEATNEWGYTFPAGTWFNRNSVYTAEAILNNPGSPDEIKSDLVPLTLNSGMVLAGAQMQARRYLTSRFDSTVPTVPSDFIIDSYRQTGFTLVSDSAVTVTLQDETYKPIEEIVPETTLAAGDHIFALDYEQLSSAGISALSNPNYRVEVNVRDLGTGDVTKLMYAGTMSANVSQAKMLGQTMVHDVLIQDGSLNLSREDVTFKGRGPQFSFTRSYNNQSHREGLKPLGQGWSHGLDLRAQILRSDDMGDETIPTWVKNLRGQFFTDADVPASLPTMVQANGTVFKKDNGVWYAERGKHGSLVENPGGPGFVYTSKDGTSYTYSLLINKEYFATAITDRNGNTLSLNYVNGRLDNVIDAVGRKFTFTYEIVPVNGVDDNRYRLVSVIGPEIDPPGTPEVDWTLSPDAVTLTFTYDGNGYLESVQRGAKVETYQYAPEFSNVVMGSRFNLSHAIATVNGKDNTHRYEYYNTGELPVSAFNYVNGLKEQDVVKNVYYPSEHHANFVFDTDTLNKREVTDLNGNTTIYTLNNYGNPTRIDEPLGKYTEMTWSIDEGKPDNVMISKTVSLGTQASPRSLTTTYKHDTKGNVIEETDSFNPVGNNTIYTTWDPTYSLPLTRIDRNGVEQRWTYDPTIEGCLIKHEVEVADGSFVATDSTCYPEGEVETVTDARGNLTRTTYDIYGNPDLVTVAEGTVDEATIDYDFDIRGRKVAETDPLGNQTAFTYDDLDYPATVRLADHLSYALPTGSNRTKTTVYDTEGNLLSETDRAGLTLDYTYTSRNQVDTITRTDRITTFGVKDFDYDGNGNLLTETDWKGVATTHTYDALNRRDTTTNRLLDSMSMVYDLAGNLTQVTDYEGRVTDYEYDDLNRQTKVIQPLLPGQTERGEIVKTYYFEADPETNLKTVTDAELNTTQFEYNGRYQKTKRINALLDEYVWQYDNAGNLEKEIDEENNEIRYVYDFQNRRTFAYKALKDEVGTIIREIPVEERQYDAAGNVRYVIDGNGNTTETIYDEWNRPWKTISPVDTHAATSYTTITELDGQGREVSVTNQSVTPGVDQVRTFVRDARGLVDTATDAENNPTRYTYDVNDNVLTITNARNVVTEITYDAEDRKLLTTEAKGSVDERITGVVLYDKVGNPLQVRDGNGNIIVTEYNDLNLPWKQYDPAPFNAQFIETLYDKNGQPTSVTNRRGHTTTTTYDELGRVDTITDPVPFNTQTLVTTYDKVGNVKTVTDKRGILGEKSYDSLYRLVEEKRDAIRLVTNEYDDASNLTATIDAENNRVEYAYNSRNLLERTTYIDPVGTDYYTEQFYDGVGNVVESFNEEFEATTSTYDKENRLKTVTFASETTENFYDAVGNLTEVKKPKLNGSTMLYDDRNRLESVTEGGLLTTAYTYDDNDNLLTQTDPLLSVVEYTYDELNRKTAHIQHKPSGNLTVTYDLYDAEGNLKQMTDAKGQLFTYDYDELNRLTTTTYPIVTTSFLTPESVVTDYDANNNVTTVTETKQISGGGTQTDVTTNNWDNFDRLDDSTQRGITIDYVYNNNGNRSSVSTVNGATTYTYDHRNRVETAVVGTDTTTYTYTPDSLVDTIAYPTGAVADYAYYPTNRVQTITHTDGVAATISSFSYTYDTNGNRTQQVEYQAQSGVTETTDYVYDVLDSLDRLESFTVNDGTTTTLTEYTFEGYNRKTEKVTVDTVVTVDKTYTYDETNWLSSVVDSVPASPVTISYSYDDNGNTTLKTDSSKPGEDIVFDYDVANRMVETTQGVTSLGQYDYNAQGMRVRHYGSSRGDVSYYYDDGAVLEEYVDGAGGGVLAHYRYGDRLLSLDNPTEGVQYYHHDALGSTVNLTDSLGSAKVSYNLDPWGHIRNQVGTSVNRQIFTGQEHDENTGLIYFGARYYDPDSARFISQDSYLGEPGTPPSLHRYLYAYSNPTVFVDLDGHSAINEWGLLDSADGRIEDVDAAIQGLDESRLEAKGSGQDFMGWKHSAEAVLYSGYKLGLHAMKSALNAADYVIDAATLNTQSGEQRKRTLERMNAVNDGIEAAIDLGKTVYKVTREDPEGVAQHVVSKISKEIPEVIEESKSTLNNAYLKGSTKETVAVAGILIGSVEPTRKIKAAKKFIEEAVDVATSAPGKKVLTHKHHTIPREVRRSRTSGASLLPEHLVEHPDIRGRKGLPNRWNIPVDEHVGKAGVNSRGYNTRFKEELKRLEKLKPNKKMWKPEDITGIRDRLVVEFDIERYRPE